jgi:SAM-dependent MidA family methyltransferase
MNSKPELKEILAAQIKDKGFISFPVFMETCLYHPQFGYYTSGKTQVGRKGDFYTSVSVGPLFGKLLAEQISQFYETFPDKKQFTIIEQGAHDGTLAHDIISHLDRLHPEIQSSYLIIEPSVQLQNQQKKTLEKYADRVNWQASWDLIPDQSLNGIFLTNELVDSFPVHLIHFKEKQWREKVVSMDKQNFIFKEEEISNPLLLNWIQRFDLPDMEGFETEINLVSQKWIKTISQKFDRGYLLTLDYGMTAEEFYSLERSHGTLQCYSQHTKNDNPLVDIGHQDITSHVNFTALHDAGEHYGFQTIAYHDQHHFLTSIISHQPDLIENEKEIRAFKTLMHPEMMGTSFKVLLQQKGLEPAQYQNIAFTKYSKKP